MKQRGFTLIEVIVAMALLAASSAMLTRSIVAAIRSGHTFASLRAAQHLADDAIERVQAGHPVPALPTDSAWQRRIEIVPEGPHLRRVAVTVEHRHDADRSVRLEALVGP